MDEQDLASEREEIARNAAINANRRDLAPLIHAECTRCGELGPTRGGVCTPCRAALEARK